MMMFRKYAELLYWVNNVLRHDSDGERAEAI